VKFCYGTNGKAATPCRLSVTSCRGIVADELDKIQGSQQWFINKEERCWLQVFERRKKDLVYLTADSPNLLTAVDPAGVYIVGGIVDRNQWKGATLMKAMNLGISHAKLPIGEHLKLTTSEVQTSVAIPLPFFLFLHKILSMVSSMK
jgi:tRNA (guanine9-N1)-methyltransferase